MKPVLMGFDSLGQIQCEAYIPAGVLRCVGANNAISFCVGNTSKKVVTDENIVFLKNICIIIKQNPKCSSFCLKIHIKYRYNHLRNIHVLFTCVGFNCQRKAKPMPSGI